MGIVGQDIESIGTRLDRIEPVGLARRDKGWLRIDSVQPQKMHFIADIIAGADRQIAA